MLQYWMYLYMFDILTIRETNVIVAYETKAYLLNTYFISDYINIVFHLESLILDIVNDTTRNECYDINIIRIFVELGVKYVTTYVYL